MAVTMTTTTHLSSPDIRTIVAPVLSCLPGAAVSKQPATNVLPHLSPILRQRVQLLADASADPWIRLLTYNTSHVPKLAEIARSESLEPHPVSGEIEIDWDYDVKIKYRRLDQETLQALVVFGELDLFTRLVYCAGDKDGGGDGWRVGELGIASNPPVFEAFGGFDSIAEAEKVFESSNALINRRENGADALAANGGSRELDLVIAEDDDDDDDYWGRYDATPSRTPAVKRSPAPASNATASQSKPCRSTSAEDAYYAQYDSVQPAMDPHDPDEEIEQVQPPPPLGLARVIPSDDSPERAELDETSGAWTLAEPPRSLSPSARSHRSQDEGRAAPLIHPRPASSASSSGSVTVAKLEEYAAKRDQTEFGVKQHISRSIRSLFLLSRSSGIDREEFETMVKTELDVLGMVEQDI